MTAYMYIGASAPDLTRGFHLDKNSPLQSAAQQHKWHNVFSTTVMCANKSIGLVSANKQSPGATGLENVLFIFACVCVCTKGEYPSKIKFKLI